MVRLFVTSREIDFFNDLVKELDNDNDDEALAGSVPSGLMDLKILLTIINNLNLK